MATTGTRRTTVHDQGSGTNGGFQAVMQALERLSMQVDELRRRTDERFDGLADLYVPRTEMESLRRASEAMVRMYEEKINGMASRSEFLQVNTEQDRRLNNIEQTLRDQPDASRSMTTIWLMAAGVAASMLCGGGGLLVSAVQIALHYLR